MNIKEYINSKIGVSIYNLTKNNEIISTFNLSDYPTFYDMKVINTNPFSGEQLFVFILNSNKLNKLFFNKINNLSNTLLFVDNDDDFKNNPTYYKKLLISHGYKYHKVDNNKIMVFIYDISEYKDNPDWLNSENWANPDLWEK